MKRKETAVKHLHAALAKVAEEMEYDLPIIHDNRVEWEGPFEWAVLIMGEASMWSEELQDYTLMQIEKPLLKVIEKIQVYHDLECTTNHSLGVY